MTLDFRLVLLALTLLGTACASDPEQKALAERQGTALQTALVQGRSDLRCPPATALLLSSDVVDKTAHAAERFEYTFDIEGCGEHTTVVVACERGSGACMATDPEGRAQPDNPSQH